jgi:2-polyprenyl-6-methoxyphenol hydroxylase-like FAD-dependent oxidoreductase
MTTWDPPIAPHRLRFLIVGGSIAGLACAYTLSKAGHEVTVFERRNGPSQVRALVLVAAQVLSDALYRVRRRFAVRRT